MKSSLLAAWAALLFLGLAAVPGRTQGDPPWQGGGAPWPGGFPPPGGGPGGPGGMMRQELKLVKRFDRDGDKRLNAEERKAAREYMSAQRAGRGPGGRPGGFGGRGEQAAPRPGPKVSPGEVAVYPDAPVYDPKVLRTFFLDFESAEWEKELADFHDTDVEVPARLTVDGRSYPDVGVHFRGMTSYMMVGEGRKRSLNLSLDEWDKGQSLGGCRVFNLLNAHEDPTFLRSVLYHQISREYIPAPKANFVRVVINGECWGVYASVEQFNKDFVKEWFGSAKGARWKVPGGPGGRGGLNYLGDDEAPYRRLFEIKSKDEPEAWAGLIRLCKVLDQAPPERLEAALAPLLDVDGTLRFLALDNALVNNDGYWTRASDYSLCQDAAGRFHLIPYDVNESFGGAGGPGGPGGFGPGPLAAPFLLARGDWDGDGKVTGRELGILAEEWFDKLDPEAAGKLGRALFSERLGQLLGLPPGPSGLGPPPGGEAGGGERPGRRGGFGPAMFLGPALFGLADADQDGAVTRAELKAALARLAAGETGGGGGGVDEQELRERLDRVLPRPEFGGPGGRRGPEGGPGMGGVELDPLVAVNDPGKPLLSKLLAVPALRMRYLGYVRDIAEKWLDWERLGPVAAGYQALIGGAVEADTRKLDSYEAFLRGIAGEAAGGSGRTGGRAASLKEFAARRRAFLLAHPAVRAAKAP